MAAPFEVPEPLEPFVDDEDAYNLWYRQHWHGYVLNASRKPGADYLYLHRVPCRTLERDEPHTTTDQSKLCSPTREDLVAWTTAEFGRAPDRCSFCDA